MGGGRLRDEGPDAGVGPVYKHKGRGEETKSGWNRGTGNAPLKPCFPLLPAVFFLSFLPL